MDDPDYVPDNYLERRRFICPNCGRAYRIFIYQRNKPYVIDCADCESFFEFDWSTEKFKSEKQIVFELY